MVVPNFRFGWDLGCLWEQIGVIVPVFLALVVLGL